jgi:hypothetical protein
VDPHKGVVMEFFRGVFSVILIYTFIITVFYFSRELGRKQALNEMGYKLENCNNIIVGAK